METADRISNYLLQRFDPDRVREWPPEHSLERLTPKQRRRVRHKENRAARKASR
jgi:hypothetical protein